MNPSDLALWQELASLPIGETGVVLDFSARLARENGWEPYFAERVVLEYRRFLLLAMRAGHVVTPSEEVDQAWHLHLVYTRSYWDDLCGSVLGRPLHHGPTEGGLAEGARFEDQYARTLASYERLFGEPPPRDIWPPAEERFAPPAARWVDVSRHWLIPKPRFLRRRLRIPSGLTALALAAGAALVLTSCVGGVMDWKGSAFLTLYVALMPTALLLSLVVVKVSRKQGRDAAPPEDPYELAFLGGGAARAFLAVTASLFERGLLKVRGKKLQRGPEEAGELSGLEEQVYRSIPEGVPIDGAALHATLRPAWTKVQSRLRREGLLSTAEEWTRLRVLAALPFVALLILGLSKVRVGVGRDRPIGFLVLLLVGTVLLWGGRAASMRRRTPAGDRAWEKAKSEHRPDSSGAEPAGLPLTVALLGGAALGGMPEYASLHKAVRTNPSQGGSDGGCGSLDGGGGGDGGSGCGGGGCGGCGG